MYPRPADLRLTTRWTNGHQIVAVAGEIDICTAPAVRAYLLDTNGGNGGQRSDLVLDLRAVTFMDARGLSTLIWADHRARQAGRHLRLAAPTARIIHLLAITHLDLHFDLHLTSEAATQARLG
jgi:anti-sigma B factor antagonist